MKVDLEHIHHWMQAIRESNNPMRTMDAFWSGQLRSKEWLIDSLSLQTSVTDDPITVDIHGGWVGVLASLLFQSTIPIKHITSLDLDPLCKHVAVLMNKKEEIEGRFQAVTADMCRTTSTADVIINTSCEHITQVQYNEWLASLPKTSLIVLQSNNYYIEEHVRPVDSLDEFASTCGLSNIMYSGEMDLPLYKRFMLIGKK